MVHLSSFRVLKLWQFANRRARLRKSARKYGESQMAVNLVPNIRIVARSTATLVVDSGRGPKNGEVPFGAGGDIRSCDHTSSILPTPR
jgi:hypothetical protein